MSYYLSASWNSRNDSFGEKRRNLRRAINPIGTKKKTRKNNPERDKGEKKAGATQKYRPRKPTHGAESELFLGRPQWRWGASLLSLSSPHPAPGRPALWSERITLPLLPRTAGSVLTCRWPPAVSSPWRPRSSPRVRFLCSYRSTFVFSFLSSTDSTSV